jgi:hypothetical protein
MKASMRLNGNAPLRARIEALRLACGPLMGLGDVKSKSYPKMCLIAAPRAGGSRRHALLHPACLPRGHRRAGGGHGRHRLRARRLGHADGIAVVPDGTAQDRIGRTPDRRIQRRARAR